MKKVKIFIYGLIAAILWGYAQPMVWVSSFLMKRVCALDIRIYKLNKELENEHR